MYYVTDENGNRADLETALSPYDYDLKTEEVSAVGVITTIDGIECYGINGTVNKVTTWLNKTRYVGKGSAIFVDKNHDLSYYFTGSDYAGISESNLVINTANKYGYEWGGYGVTTGIYATDIGAGLNNTNSLIEMNLQSQTEGWPVVWDRIKEFRETRSSLWFLPSHDELNLIYEARSNLSGLTTIDNSVCPYYWSSSENSSYFARRQNFNTGSQSNSSRDSHNCRSRLCRQY